MKLKSFLYAFICTLSVACIQEERFEGNLYETPDKVYAVIEEDTESKTYLGDEIKVLWSRNFMLKKSLPKQAFPPKAYLQKWQDSVQ